MPLGQVPPSLGIWEQNAKPWASHPAAPYNFRGGCVLVVMGMEARPCRLGRLSTTKPHPAFETVFGKESHWCNGLFIQHSILGLEMKM